MSGIGGVLGRTGAAAGRNHPTNAQHLDLEGQHTSLYLVL
jgi:hypothetical protein